MGVFERSAKTNIQHICAAEQGGICSQTDGMCIAWVLHTCASEQNGDSATEDLPIVHFTPGISHQPPISHHDRKLAIQGTKRNQRIKSHGQKPNPTRQCTQKAGNQWSQTHHCCAQRHRDTETQRHRDTETQVRVPLRVFNIACFEYCVRIGCFIACF